MGGQPGQPGASGLQIAVSADWPWAGKIRFDVPRHAEYFKMPTDYPRLNQFPEWFTVKPEAQFSLGGAAISGEALRAGLPVKVDGKTVALLELRNAP